MKPRTLTRVNVTASQLRALEGITKSRQQPASVAQVAKHFGVDAATVRRWLQRGCPCLQQGRRGPGGGARLDLQQVRAWRGSSPVSPGLTCEEVLQRVASALGHAVFQENAGIRAGIDRAAAAAVCLVAFEQCCSEFQKSYPFDQYPPAIRALLRVL